MNYILYIFIITNFLLVNSISNNNLFKFKNNIMSNNIINNYTKNKNKIYVISRLSIKKIDIIYNNLLSKFYKLSFDYYSMSEEDKTIVDTICTLYF